MRSVSIRKARRSDVGRLAALTTCLGYRQSPSEAAARLRLYENSGGSVWVAELEGEVAGYLSFHVQPCFHADEMLGRITAMCVAPERKRLGIGRLLIERMEEDARHLGVRRVEVTSGEHRAEEAHRFYRAMGYAETSRRFVKVIGEPA